MCHRAGVWVWGCAMAFGDVATGQVLRILNGDTLVVQVFSGPGAGGVQVWRDSTRDVEERFGPWKFIGQSAIGVARDFVESGGGIVNIDQVGVDQFGRVVGAVGNDDRPGGFGAALGDEGFGSAMSAAGSPPEVTISSDPRFDGDSGSGPLVVDTTLP